MSTIETNKIDSNELPSKNNNTSIESNRKEMISANFQNDYDPYNGVVKNSLVEIDKNLKLSIPVHPMEYNIFSNGINKFLKSKYFKKYFK